MVIPGASRVVDREEYTTNFSTAFAAEIYIPSDFESYEDDPDDYAVIILDQNIGNSTGWFSMSSANDHTLSVANITGYTVDNSGDSNDTFMYRTTGPISQSDYELSYQMDADDGNSGSPIYDSNHNVVGIHTRGIPTCNYDVSIGNDIYSFVMAAINNSNWGT